MSLCRGYLNEVIWTLSRPHHCRPFICLPIVKLPCPHTVARKSRGFPWIQLRADLLPTRVAFTNTSHRRTLPRRKTGRSILRLLQQSPKSRSDIKTHPLSTRLLPPFPPPRSLPWSGWKSLLSRQNHQGLFQGRRGGLRHKRSFIRLRGPKSRFQRRILKLAGWRGVRIWCIIFRNMEEDVARIPGS